MYSNFKWDVPAPPKNGKGRYDRDELKQLIPYFDPELSYEITGYRPLSMTKGLDFQPEWFNEAGRTKDSEGSYTKFPTGSKSYRDWWKAEIMKCRNGVEVNGYRVTGDHYFFLNYYTLMDTDVEKAGAGRKEGRPKFYAKQYEFFHYIEICEYLGKDVISFKARGVGFSEIMASLVVKGYTCHPGFVNIISAHTEALMYKTLQKVWKQLDWLNANTEGGMKRLRQKYDRDDFKKASLVKKGSDKEEYGWLSSIWGVTADKANKLRGDRVDRLIFEEGGSDPILKQKYTQSEALVEIGGNRFGTRFVIGTGGDSGPNLAGLEDMYLNPAAYKGLLYRHNYTEDGSYTLSAFFIAAHTFSFVYVDHRGVTDEAKAKAYYMNSRKEYGTDVEGLLMHCAEFCFYAEEALIRQGQNQFDKKLLSQQVADIKIHKRVPPPERGDFFWVYEGKNESSKIIGVKWVPSPTGRVFINEHPIKDPENGAVFRNLYIAGIDSIDHAIDDSVVGEKGSKFAIVIKKRTMGNGGDKYVAGFIERPHDVRKAYTTATQMLWYFNCKANLEDTKIGYRNWLREKHLDIRFLMLRPNVALDVGRRRNPTLWGTPGSEKMIRHGLALVASYILDFCHNIPFLEALEQLLKFSFERKGEFDWVMAMVYCEIADEDMYNLTPAKVDVFANNWVDVGYYTDSNGKKRYGPIPRQEQPRYKIGSIGAISQTITEAYNPYSRDNINKEINL